MNIGAIMAATVLVAAVGLFIGIFLGVAGIIFLVFPCYFLFFGIFSINRNSVLISR